ncbi:hypothetical protein K505DRAFT_390939 [Melanomma pulvis-pyrius CBS 109.77]|uniref:Uncharacterized protein n=1 Tax=Melanomma pulvis-pyrius CBS 109.77 TaxID=1314802 RepID=A0A6A6XS68_9PLEO|nr:hypothetical protein K505DRAFT_390939 [Melanomma pulvis-pyrius CBS 109.77]
MCDARPASAAGRLQAAASRSRACMRSSCVVVGVSMDISAALEARRQCSAAGRRATAIASARNGARCVEAAHWPAELVKRSTFNEEQNGPGSCSQPTGRPRARPGSLAPSARPRTGVARISVASTPTFTKNPQPAAVRATGGRGRVRPCAVERPAKPLPMHRQAACASSVLGLFGTARRGYDNIACVDIAGARPLVPQSSPAACWNSPSTVNTTADLPFTRPASFTPHASRLTLASCLPSLALPTLETKDRWSSPGAGSLAAPRLPSPSLPRHTPGDRKQAAALQPLLSIWYLATAPVHENPAVLLCLSILFLPQRLRH